MADDDDNLSSYLDEFTPLVVIKHLNSTHDPIDAEIARYLEFYRPNIAFASAPPPPIEALGSMVKRIKQARPKESTYVVVPPRRSDAVTWAFDFLMEIFAELHAIICGKGKTPSKLGDKSQAALTALAAVIVQHLGVSDTTALGIAVLVLLSLGRATKKVFCKTTRPEDFKAYLGW